MMRTEQPIAFQIRSLNNQLKRLMERTAILDNDANLTGVQYGILGFLHEHADERDIFQRDIETEFNIRRSTATGLLQNLEKNGYIRRENVPEDARLKKIIQTDKAKKLGDFARKNLEALNIRLTRGISDKELAQFNATIEKIKENSKV